MLDNKKTVCLYGHTENENYGGCLTYYALGKTIESLGYDLIIIPRSYDVTEDVCSLNPYYPDSPSVIFFEDNFHMAERLPFSRFNEYNSLADTFILGSDMIWKDKQYRWSHDTFYLNFVNDDKNKISYATSFGSSDISDIYDEGRCDVAMNYINRFNHISVREDWGKEFLNSKGIECEWMPDPVFLLSKYDYMNIISDRRICHHYNVYYLIRKSTMNDFLREKSKPLIYNKDYKKKVFISDGHLSINKKYSNKLILPRPDISEFLNYIYNADYVVTDSFHGLCFCLIFNKPFKYISRINDTIRMESLARLFDFDLRINMKMNLDWEKINDKLVEIRKTGLEWLKKSIEDK